MITIKAVKKDKKGRLYCKPGSRKFYYEVGKTYRRSRKYVKMCKRGFHASAHCDIGETLRYYDIGLDTTYCLVDIDVVEEKDDKVVGDYIKILKEITNLDELIKFDKTGRWTYEYAKKFGHHKKLMWNVIEKDDTGKWCVWYARQIIFKEELMEAVINKDKTGEWSTIMAVVLGHNKRLMQNVIKKDKTGRWCQYYLTEVKGLTLEEQKELTTEIKRKFEPVFYKKKEGMK